MRDPRNPLAKARDAWLASKAGEACQAGTASGQYLRNRLERAFIAGWDARERHVPQRMTLGPTMEDLVKRAKEKGMNFSKEELAIIDSISVTPEQLTRIGKLIRFPMP